MRRNPHYGIYIFMTAVILLIAFVSMGYSSWVDTLQVGGSIFVVLPTPTPTEVPPPLGFSVSDIGYFYNPTPTFESPFWWYTCNINSQESTYTVRPSTSWADDVLTVRNQVNIPLPDGAILYHFRNKVGAAVRYDNLTGASVKFLIESTSHGNLTFSFVKQLPPPLNYFHNNKKIVLEKQETMVVSLFCEDNWAIPNGSLNLRALPNNTYTETRQGTFSVDGRMCTIRFILSVTAVDNVSEAAAEFSLNDVFAEGMENGDAGVSYEEAFSPNIQADEEIPGFSQMPGTTFPPLETISPTPMASDNVSIHTEEPVETPAPTPLPDIFPTPSELPEEAPEPEQEEVPVSSQPPEPTLGPIFPKVDIANTGYEDTLKKTFNAPYWAYAYKHRTGENAEKRIEPVAYWEKNLLVVYTNLFIPQGGSPEEALLKSFDSTVGVALRFENGTGTGLEFASLDATGGLNHSFALPGTSVSRSADYTLASGETLVLSVFTDRNWAMDQGLDLEHLSGMTYQAQKEFSIRVTNPVANESRTYTVRFVLSIKTTEPEPTSVPTEAPMPTETPEPTETPTPTLTPTSVPTETPAPMPAPTPEPTPVPIPALTETYVPASTPALAGTFAETAAPEVTLTAILQPLAMEMALAEPSATPSSVTTLIPTSEPTPKPTPAPEPSPEGVGTEDAGTGGS